MLMWSISKTGGAKTELPPEGGGERGYMSARCDKSSHLDALLRRTTHLRHVIIADLLARDVHIERANIDSRRKLPHMKQSQVTDAGVKKELSKKLQAVDGDHRQEFEQMAGVCLSVCWPIP